MKQLITSIIFLALTNSGKSQVAVLATVSDIASYSNAATTTLFIKDTIRGGQFLLYSGNDTADDGMIFTDALSQKWKRVTTNSKLNAQWYGIASSRPGYGYTVDMRSKFITIRDYIYTHPVFNTIYIPTDTSLLSSSYYYISDSILFNKPINITGDGTFGNPTSKIMFAGHKSGFVFQYSYDNLAFSSSVTNLYIASSSSIIGGIRNSTKHAIISRTLISIDNVIITDIDGDGIHISACAIPATGDNNNYGNADGSSISNVWINFCLNGIFIEGCDANTINLTNTSTNQNARWGIFDNGLLGNIYTKPHCAFNGAGGLTRQNSVVTYGGKNYVAIPGHDGYFGDAPDSNYAKRPDTTVGTYWRVVGTMVAAGAWNATTRYYSGGPIAIVNQNAWTNIINSYTEAFQPPIWLNYRSKVDGGDNGAGVKGGVYETVSSGIKYIYNSSLGLPSINDVTQDTIQKYFTINKPAIDYAAPLVVHNDQSRSGNIVVANFETTATSVYLGLKNPYSTGYIGYNVNDINFYTEGLGGLRAQLNSTGFIPGANNTLDIGTSSAKWKTGYFSTSLFNPLLIGGSTSGGNLTLSSTSHATKGKIIFGSTSVYNEANGYFGLNTTAPSAFLDINSDKVRIRIAKTPSSSTDTGNAGDMCWDPSYIYICVATNTWKRVAINSW